jgi:hypothetical protein
MATFRTDSRPSPSVPISGMWLAMILISWALSLPKACGQWGSYTPPTIGDIVSETKTAPGPSNRTTLGMGEKVDCRIDRQTWVDKDCYGDWEEDDAIGSISWSANAFGQGWPITGDTCTVITDARPCTVTATATITDSGTRGLDSPITRSIDFDVIEPDGCYIEELHDLARVKAPPTNYVGVWTMFDLVTTPTTVSFCNVVFSEEIPLHEWVYPSGTPSSWGPLQKLFGVEPGNLSLDDCRYTVNHEAVQNGGQYQDFTNTIVMKLSYWNYDGVWIPWYFGKTHWNKFRAADQKGQEEVQVDNTDHGDWMGPWKEVWE